VSVETRTIFSAYTNAGMLEWTDDGEWTWSRLEFLDLSTDRRGFLNRDGSSSMTGGMFAEVDDLGGGAWRLDIGPGDFHVYKSEQRTVPDTLQFDYDFGDGQSASTRITGSEQDTSTSHVYTTGGVYAVTVKIHQYKDGVGLGRLLGTGTCTVTIGKTPAVIDFGGYSSSYSFPNYARSG
jgi:hypothetical protein